MKKLLISLATIIIITAVIIGIVLLGKNKNPDMVVSPLVPPVIQTIPLCFYYESKTSRGLYDVSWLKLNITGENVTGEFRNLPAETDSKVGTFTGTVGPVDKVAMARTADVWWDSMAEGMQVQEQLKIMFGEGIAQAEFGEMVDRGDGVYVYKDQNQFTFGFPMSDVTCSDLDDRIIVEKYVRANIGTIAPEKPVLGGSWYALNVHVDPVTKTGTTTYEDGHIQGKANFQYERDGEQVSITNVVKTK